MICPPQQRVKSSAAEECQGGTYAEVLRRGALVQPVQTRAQAARGAKAAQSPSLGGPTGRREDHTESQEAAEEQRRRRVDHRVPPERWAKAER